MYIKVFESRQSSKSYLLQYRLALNNGEQDKFVLEDQDHKSIIVLESEIFKSLDNLFRGMQNERQKENGQDGRQKDDGRENEEV